MAATKPTEPEVEIITAGLEIEIPTTGFNVFAGETFLGNYETQADAEAFISCQVAPQGIAAEVKAAG